MRRQLSALLLLYVTLDFANPLMPGAVRFEAGSIEVVQADRTARAARSAAAPARLPVASPIWTRNPGDVTLARPVPAPLSAPALALPAVRRAPPQHFAAPTSPSEDH
ncbi:MAG TPA: hypothetical protein VHO73_05295 [Methylomirabilota bacterium]|jgi:hypothetical protein|nr:hypothetical protein [Methylomirabilota bacterium]